MKPKTGPYIRDKRSPVPKSAVVSNVMRANTRKNTKPEVTFRKLLWSNGIRGYRVNWKKAPGTPDIAFPGRKLAIFINGCFWHRCLNCAYPLPKHNTDFWQAKFEKNVTRDKAKIDQLEKLGWKVLTIWECGIKNNIAHELKKVIAEIDS